MIVRHIPMRAIRKSSFSELLKYLTNKQGKQERVGDIQISHCHNQELAWAMEEIAATQALNQRAKGDKTYHLLISFAPGENPSPEVLKAIEEEVTASIGFAEHQRISVVHHDTDNVHVHVAINKIHPKHHTLHEPFRAYKTLGLCAEKLEIQYGLQHTNHKPKKVISENIADDMEHHAGIESLTGWIKRHCLTALEEASSWSEFHQVLSEHGLQIREGGNGFIFTDKSGVRVKASTICRSLSKNKLEHRLGVFEVINKNQEDSPFKRYKKSPIHRKINTDKLYAQFRQEQTANKNNLSYALSAAKAQKNQSIQQAKQRGQLKRAAIKLIKCRRVTKKILYATVSKTLQADIQKIRTQHFKERQNIFNQFQRRCWADWLQKQALNGDSEALAVLRERPSHRFPDRNSFVGDECQNAKTVSGFEMDNITKEGTRIYRGDSCTIRDKGHLLNISRGMSMEGLKTALEMAIQRFGTCIKVSGSESFKTAVVQVAAYHKLNITFDDIHLEHQRQQLIHSMKQEPFYEPSNQSQLDRRTRIGRGNEHAGSTIFKTDLAGRQAAGVHPGQRINKPNIGRIGQSPPPENKNRLRNLSELRLVQLAGRCKMLLSGHVHDQLERQGAKLDNAVRRSVFGNRMRIK